MKVPSLLALLCLSLLVSTAPSQTLEVFAGKYLSGNGPGFMQPLADAFAADINSGLFQDAWIASKGFRMSVSVVGMGAPVTESRKTFRATTEGFFNPPASVDAPTIFGSNIGSSVRGTGGTVYNFPGGMSVNMFSIAVPQITIGSLYGTEGLIRFFQLKFGEDIGTMKLLGFGARHSISQYFRRLPVSLAFGIYQQHFEIGNIVNANSTFLSVQASYRTGVLVLYGGPGVEISSMDISYTNAGIPVSFTLDGANSLRFTIGAAVTLAIVRIFADYNLASQPAIAAGLGFVF